MGDRCIGFGIGVTVGILITYQLNRYQLNKALINKSQMINSTINTATQRMEHQTFNTMDKHRAEHRVQIERLFTEQQIRVDKKLNDLETKIDESSKTQ